MSGGALEQDLRRRALRTTRSCWPQDPVERAELEEAHFGLAMPVSEPGQTLLVSVAPEAGRAALWVTTMETPPGLAVVRLVGSAAAAGRRGLQLALRDHPLPGPGRIELALRRPPSVVALRVIKDGPGIDERLDGESFGLALGLAAASWLACVALPDDVVALATLDAGGWTGPVESLARKLAIIEFLAPGVRRVLVAPTQVDEAMQSSSGNLRVEGCPSLGAALDAVLPVDEEALRELEGERRENAVRRLFGVAVGGVPVALSWDGVARALDALAAGPSLNEDLHRQAEFARAVALRHAGRQEGLIPWDEAWLGRFPRPTRLRLAAHLVQEAGDGAFDEIEVRLALARGMIAPPLDRHGDDLRLLGAVGRAEAALHRWGQAAEDLGAAVAGWEALDRGHEASHPLCELLRVAGIAGDSDAVEANCGGGVARLLADPRTTETSSAFLRLAAGRAWAQVGRYEEARAELGGDGWEIQAPHLRSSRLRWLAHAHEVAGDRTEAENSRRQAATIVDGVPGHEEFGLLVALDAALATGADTSAVMATLATGGRSAPEMARLRALRCADPADVARVWRY